MLRQTIARKNLRGFTLIELVVVITILGILAAFAIPRFISLQTNARAATIQSLQGALRSASMLTHSMWMASGSPGTVAMEGATITMVNGYPTYADINKTLMDSSGFNYDPLTGTYTKVGAATPATCSATYTPPAALGSAPVIVYDASDCS